MELLLDTNAMIWFLNGSHLNPNAIVEIAQAQADSTLYVSPISAWEAALALRKPEHRRPDLKGQDAATWFSSGYRAMGAKVIPIRARIAIEASRIPAVSNNGDPGDCYIIATARVRHLAIVTRDRVILSLATRQPNYVDALAC